MEKAVSLTMPDGWNCVTGIQDGPFGCVINHASATSSDGLVQIEIDESEMPQDSTAPDQALTNYVDMVGFDNDDPEDFNPIEKWEFNRRSAYGFQVYCEDESQIRVMCIEHHKGRLAVISVQGPDENGIEKAVRILERNLRFFSSFS